MKPPKAEYMYTRVVTDYGGVGWKSTLLLACLYMCAISFGKAFQRQLLK